jgi:hypothetical protein
MKHNVGSFDAAARAVLGFALIALGHHYRNWWGLVGLVPFFTGAIGFCPIYWLIGYDTTTQDEYDDRHLPPPSRTKNV